MLVGRKMGQIPTTSLGYITTWTIYLWLTLDIYLQPLLHKFMDTLPLVLFTHGWRLSGLYACMIIRMFFWAWFQMLLQDSTSNWPQCRLTSACKCLASVYNFATQTEDTECNGIYPLSHVKFALEMQRSVHALRVAQHCKVKLHLVLIPLHKTALTMRKSY